MARSKLHLTFPEHLIDEPVMYRLSTEFGVVPNIRRANVDDRYAWVILELDGDPAALAAAEAWLMEQGVAIDRIPDEGHPDPAGGPPP